jgi:putative ABC transport system permease protein
MSRDDRFFRRLLRLFPADFRGDFGDEMTRTFQQHRDDVAARGGPMAQLRLWKDTVLGILATAPREHWDLLRQDVRYGLRGLRRSPGFAAVAIAALAVGIGANAAIFSIVNGVLLEPLPYRDPDRLITVFEKIPGVPVEKFGFSAPDFAIVRSATRSFDGMAAYKTVSYELSGLGRSERVVVARATPDLFPVLGVVPAIGHPFTEADDNADAKVAVLSHALWRRAFDRDPGVLGRTVALDRVPYVVVGVMPERFVFPTRGAVMNGEPADLYVPMAFTPLERGAFGSMYNNSTVARLKPDVTLEQARADLAAAAGVLAPSYPAEMQGFAGKMVFPTAPFAEEAVGRSRRLLLVLMGAVAMVLLICCADVANLMLTRSGARQRELAVRSALGASQVRVVRQLLTESLVLGLGGAAVGLCLAFGIMSVAVPMAGEALPRPDDIRINGRVLAFTAALALLTPLLFGVLPALRSALTSTAAMLAEGSRTATAGRGRQRLLGTLVVAQCALALVLSVGAGLLLRSFVRLMQTETGFRAEHVVNATMVLPSGRYPTGRQVKAFYRDAVAAAAAIPGVTVAGAATHRPLNVQERRAFSPDPTATRDPTSGGTVATTWTVGRYFETLGIPLKAGRLFSEGDGLPGTGRVVIVSEMLARRLWPNGDAIGRRLKWGGEASPKPWMTIVGVVGDVKQGALDSEIILQTYEPLTQEVADDLGLPVIRFHSEVNLIVRSDRPPATVGGELSAALRRLDPELAVSSVRPVLEIVDDSVRAQRFSTTLLGVFAVVALSLAALGIYGVLANVVAAQTKEIGLRLALGAATWSVRWLVLRRALALTAVGLAIGLAGATALTRVMGGLLYEVQPHDAVTFVGASLGMAVLVLFASLVPAWRATRVDPIVALRAE